MRLPIPPPGQGCEFQSLPDRDTPRKRRVRPVTAVFCAATTLIVRLGRRTCGGCGNLFPTATSTESPPDIDEVPPESASPAADGTRFRTRTRLPTGATAVPIGRSALPTCRQRVTNGSMDAHRLKCCCKLLFRHAFPGRTIPRRAPSAGDLFSWHRVPQLPGGHPHPRVHPPGTRPAAAFSRRQPVRRLPLRPSRLACPPCCGPKTSTAS